MAGNYSIHLINQIRAFKDDVPSAFLEVTYLNILVFVNGSVLFADMSIEPDGKIVAILRNRFTIQQIQHTDLNPLTAHVCAHDGSEIPNGHIVPDHQR